MAESLSTYLATKVGDWTHRGAAMPAAPTNVYCSLHTDDPGGTGANELVVGSSPSYARVAVPCPAGWNAGTPSGGGMMYTNVNNVTFAVATGNWQVALFAGLWDALTVGNFLEGWALDQAVAVLNGEQWYIPAGNIQMIYGPTVL